MTSIRVVPNPNGDGWAVQRGRNNRAPHRTVSTHRKKSTAKRRARRLGNKGDELTILKSNGQIQDRIEMRA
jgi:hypothetical protein